MRAAKVDANHGEIVKALRDAGASVQSLATVGKGCPDLVVGKGPDTFLIEVKGPKGKLTDDQVKFIGEWRGVVHIVRTVDDALQLVGVAQVRDI
jgi:Holliday junction resolvase